MKPLTFLSRLFAALLLAGGLTLAGCGGGGGGSGDGGGFAIRLADFTVEQGTWSTNADGSMTADTEAVLLYKNTVAETRSAAGLDSTARFYVVIPVTLPDGTWADAVGFAESQTNVIVTELARTGTTLKYAFWRSNNAGAGDPPDSGSFSTVSGSFPVDTTVYLSAQFDNVTDPDDTIMFDPAVASPTASDALPDTNSGPQKTGTLWGISAKAGVTVHDDITFGDALVQ